MVNKFLHRSITEGCSTLRTNVIETDCLRRMERKDVSQLHRYALWSVF